MSAYAGILEAAAAERAFWTDLAAARMNVIGIGADEGVNPTMLAAVKDNRLIKFEIDDELLEGYRDQPVELSVAISSVIQVAFEDWRRQVSEAMAP